MQSKGVRDGMSGNIQDAAYKVVVRGRVTGIGFRYSALDVASGLPGLKGHVRNLSRGEVEAVVQGPPELVAKMLDWLRRGPPGARVDGFEMERIQPDPSAGDFTIRETWRD